MALRAGYKGIKKYVADMLNKMNPGDSFATDAEIAASAQQIYEDMGVVGVKNLLNNTGVNKTQNNITFTVNPDKTVSLSNNTASAATTFDVNTSLNLTEGDKVTLSGCPSGGSENTYYLRVGKKTSAGDNWGELVVRDTGNGVTFVVPSNTYGFVVSIGVISGTTVNNLVFKPMIRLATDTDPTYQPYAETNLQLTQNKVDISALGTQEGTTASRLYNPGDHFYKDGKFCTAIAIITIGTTFTLNTNYIVEDVANSLKGFNLNTIFSNLSYVPFGFGRIGLSASASPTGSELGVDYVKFGNPEGAFIIAGRPFSGILYLTSFYQNTWSEWKSFDLSSIS